MKKILSAMALVGALVVGSAGAAAGHQAGPCNDSDGDGEFSGQEYAHHHIVPAAHDGVLGQGHKPGSHNGFALCNPSGK